jgi:hypothetical protein
MKPTDVLLKNLEGTGDQRRPVDLDDVLFGIVHRLDDGTSKLKTVYDRLLAIENEMKRSGSRGGFARYLVAICIGVAVALTWQSYGEATKQVIAITAPQLGWSPEAKQMIASWIEPLGRTKPGGPESTAVQSSVPKTQVATVAQIVPAKAAATSSIDPEQVQKIALDLAALGRTVDQLAVSQDQMVHQIDMLQTSKQEILASNQAILAKIPAPPPPPLTVAPGRKPTPVPGLRHSPSSPSGGG